LSESALPIYDDAQSSIVALVDGDFNRAHHTKIRLYPISRLRQVDVIRTNTRRHTISLSESLPLLWQCIGQPGQRTKGMA
jgi:hypothetical protein